jgi:hypothetical protein
MTYQAFKIIFIFVITFLFSTAVAADKAKEFVPDDDKGPEIGAAPTDTGKAVKTKDMTLNSSKVFVPDDDKGPDIGAAPTGSDSTGKTKKDVAEKNTAKEFIPDDDKGPEIGAAPTQ